MTTLRPYDHKVFITGPYQSGKTRLVHALDPHAVSIDRPLPKPYRGQMGSTTTGFDLGKVVWFRELESDEGVIIPKRDFIRESHGNGIAKEIELRGVPGMLHVKFVRDTMRSYTDLVLLIVDSTNPDILDEAMVHLEEARSAFQDIPIEVIANKQDRDDAVAPETVAKWLGIERATGLSTCDSELCRKILARFLKKHLP